ncbi:hypothetical protein Tco_0040926 [Tanacetum coccineum]
MTLNSDGVTKFLLSYKAYSQRMLFDILVLESALAISTTEAEYVSAGKACQQALWMKQALIDYDVRLDDVPIMNDWTHSINRVSPLLLLLVSILVRVLFRVIMPRKSSEDHKNTRHYIPIISHEYRSPIKERLRNLESRYIHEDRVVFEDFTDLCYVRSLFSFLEFECLLEINDQIYPRFILEFYSEYQIKYIDEGQMLIEFVIQNQFFSYTLEVFAQILNIPYEGACVFTDKWSLDELAYGVSRDGPYQTNPPYPDDIILYVQNDQEGHVTRTRYRQKINVQDYQILTREIVSTLKPLEEIIWENVFCLGGNWDHVPACLCYILYCIARSKKFNLAYYMAKRMEWVTKQASNTPRTLIPLRPNLGVLQSSSPSPPNAPSKTPSTKDTSSTFSIASSSFKSKPQSSPPTSNDTPSPQPSNPFLKNVMDAPPRPSHPLLLQSHPSLDITLSLSLITPLDHILDTPSPPSPQP